MLPFWLTFKINYYKINCEKTQFAARHSFLLLKEIYMKKYKSILFDVDGTLINSEKGLLGAYKCALENIGMPIPEDRILRRCLGPSPRQSLKEVLGVPDEKMELAYILNRGYFLTQGYKDFEIIKGMDDLVKDLQGAGYKLFTASTKVEWVCELCVERMGLSDCFTKVCGASNDNETRVKKEDVINYAISCGAEDAIIVGDRKFDIDGGKACGIDTVGITFGFGEEEEIVEHSPTYICKTIDELRDLFL